MRGSEGDPSLADAVGDATTSSSRQSGAWSIQLFYLCFFAATGAFLPYLGLYLQAIKLDGAQIGLAVSLSPLAGVLLPPFWGMISDRFGWRKRLLVGTLLVATLVAPLARLLGSFPALLALIAVIAVAISPVVPLADATTMEWLRRHGGTYGSLRVFGSLGFLLASLCAGVLFGGHRILWLYPCYAALLGCTFLAALTLPTPERMAVHADGEGMRSVLRRGSIVRFLLLTAIGCGSVAAYNTFFPLYLKGLGAGTGVVGLAIGIATACEIPAMALSGRALTRWGVKPLLLAGMGACVVRWVAYALIHDYRLALLFQPLHGLTFATYYVAGVSYIEHQVPARFRTTGQTLFNGAIFGLGVVLEGNLFGQLYDRLHGNGIFALASIFAAVALVGLAAGVPNVRID